RRPPCIRAHRWDFFGRAPSAILALPARTGRKRSPGARQSFGDRSDLFRRNRHRHQIRLRALHSSGRWADISDIEKLKMQIDERMVRVSGEGLSLDLRMAAPGFPVVRRPTLFLSWAESMARLGAAASAIK